MKYNQNASKIETDRGHRLLPATPDFAKLEITVALSIVQIVLGSISEKNFGTLQNGHPVLPCSKKTKDSY